MMQFFNILLWDNTIVFFLLLPWDNSGFSLVLKGNYKYGKIVLKINLLESKKSRYFNQIPSRKNDEGSVTQSWIILDEKNKMLQETFRGIYKKFVKTSKNWKFGTILVD